MTDETLRLPDTLFRAVLDLGELPLLAPALPDRFRNLLIDASYDDESDSGGIFFRFDDGQLHIQFEEFVPQLHFHDADGAVTSMSPWVVDDTEVLLEWVTAFYAHTVFLLLDLIEDADAAAQWYHEGLTVYTHLTLEPTPLEIVEVTIPGHQLMLPWLGSGHIDHEHDEDGSIYLVWNPEHDTPIFTIARAWRDNATGQPASEGLEDVDWDAVGLPETEVCTWLESVYLNDVVMENPADLILRAALDRIAGIQRD